jgi:hypothetical protein
MKTLATLLLLLVTFVKSAQAVRPTEVAEWLNPEIESLLRSGNCNDLQRAATLLAAEQVLHDKYPAAFPDRKNLIKRVLTTLEDDCRGASPAYLGEGSSLGPTVKAGGSGGRGGGGGTHRVPATVLAYTYMSPDERRAFEASLPSSLKAELEAYIKNNKEQLQGISFKANEDVLRFRTKDILNNVSGTRPESPPE